jgi:hypothetical protein
MEIRSKVFTVTLIHDSSILNGFSPYLQSHKQLLYNINFNELTLTPDVMM